MGFRRRRVIRLGAPSIRNMCPTLSYRTYRFFGCTSVRKLQAGRTDPTTSHMLAGCLQLCGPLALVRDSLAPVSR